MKGNYMNLSKLKDSKVSLYIIKHLNPNIMNNLVILMKLYIYYPLLYITIHFNT